MSMDFIFLLRIVSMSARSLLELILLLWEEWQQILLVRFVLMCQAVEMFALQKLLMMRSLRQGL